MEVPGLREALVTLKKLDATIYQSMVTNLDTVTAPMRQAIQNNIPSIAPLSGFVHKGRTKWPNGKVSVRTNVRRRKSRRGGKEAVIRIIVKNAAVEIADMAGAKNDIAYGKLTRDYKYKGGTRRHTVNGQGASMIGALNLIGKASRFVWPAANRYRDTVSVEVEKVLQDSINKATEELRKRYA
jgi:hypothetical protein